MKKRNLVLSVMTTCLVSCFLLSGCNGQKQIDSETVKTVKVEDRHTNHQRPFLYVLRPFPCSLTTS